MVSWWWQVYSCASCASAIDCAIHVVLTSVIPIFGHICPYPLFTCARAALGGVHLICQQHRHAMSSKPFHRIALLCILYPYAPCILWPPLLIVMVFFCWYLPPSSLTCPCYYWCHQHRLITGTLYHDASCLFLLCFFGVCPCLRVDPLFYISRMRPDNSST